MARAPAEALRESIATLPAEGMDWETYSVRAVSRVAKVVGVDTWCAAAADPSTLLMTKVTADGELGAGLRFFELEYGERDFLMQSELAYHRPHVGVLSHATGQRLDRSVRWRECFEPFGLGDQLRAALVDRGSCWGFMSFSRHASGPAFTASDQKLVSELLNTLARGFRLTLLMRGGTGPAPEQRGLLILGDDLAIVASTPGTERLLGQELLVGSRPPPGVLAAALRARAGGTGDPVTARLRGDTGWLTVHATPLEKTAPGQTLAVFVEPARPAELADLIVKGYGFTRREAEVARHVLSGRSTEEIAASLYISVLTVQQHLKSIFAKVGVRSRREFVTRVFLQHYLPLTLASPDIDIEPRGSEQATAAT